jgi:H+-transporting ATPase
VQQAGDGFSVRLYEDAAPPTSPTQGLSAAEVEQARAQFGPNEVVISKVGPLRLFAAKFFGFTPCALELMIVAALALQSWALAGIVAILLVLNAVIGFVQEMRARRAVDELQESLKMIARCLRAGKWTQLAARELVPGDIVRLRHGDVVPADVALVADVTNVSVDQSALTGESDAIDKGLGAQVLGGSIVKTGEALAVVVATGLRTNFGASIRLVAVSKPKLHIERLMFRVILVLMIVAALFLIVGIVILVANASTRGSFVGNIPLFLALLISAIPAALPAMFSLTLALGSQELARNGVLVTRLSATEDASSMDLLCTDKTGTLTSNQLSVVDSFAIAPHTRQEMVQYAALACKKEDFDAIDGAILRAAEATSPDYALVDFQPFSASTRKTVAVVRGAQGTLRVSKGAVETLLSDCAADAALRALIANKVSEIAESKGFRSIAVALDNTFLGVLFLADPPRATSQAVVERMHQLGVRVLMLTGDSVHIANHVAQQIGLADGGNAVRRHVAGEPIADKDIGFAEIFPEEKHAIVAQLQAQGHIVGMTGDGVNDAAALKQAEVGIAMSNATDVAKSAASAVFLREGLDSMPIMVSVGRQIHARLRT